MADTHDVRVPDIGDFDAVDIIEVLVAEGDTVEVDTPLITLESDKASMEVPSDRAGVVASLAVSVGDQVKEGDVIVSLRAGDAAGDTDSADASNDADAAADTPAAPEA
ncbi:MAG: biotin/lipoyl-containing protein, partial [Acidobacteriota bacterium]